VLQVDSDKPLPAITVMVISVGVTEKRESQICFEDYLYTDNLEDEKN